MHLSPHPLKPALPSDRQMKLPASVADSSTSKSGLPSSSESLLFHILKWGCVHSTLGETHVRTQPQRIQGTEKEGNGRPHGCGGLPPWNSLLQGRAALPCSLSRITVGSVMCLTTYIWAKMKLTLCKLRKANLPLFSCWWSNKQLCRALESPPQTGNFTHSEAAPSIVVPQ